MNIQEEYRLSQYQDLGKLGEKENIRLKRHNRYGTICVEKKINPELFPVYDFLKEYAPVNTPEIYDCILTDDSLIVVEEYIEGRNLDEILSERKLDEEEAVWVVGELYKILRVLHSATPPIICRDIKAENVMIDRKHQLKLVDFDIARIFHEGKKRDTRLLGTAEYAAPEQFGFFQTDNRTDIYSLGVLLNYIVTRKFPVEEMADGRLGEIIKKCTYIDPKERYQTVDELWKQVQKLYPEYVEKEKGGKENLRIVPPGFRSKTPWKMLVAVLGYWGITDFCFTMEITSKSMDLTEYMIRTEQALIWVSQIIYICIVCNYCGIRDHIMLLNSRHRIVRIIGYFIAEVVLVISSAFMCSICESLIF